MQLTVRFDDQTAHALRRIADRDGLSLNQVTVRLVREAAGLGAPERRPVVGRALDAFVGGWTEAQARELEDALKSQAQIDTEAWR